MPPEERRGLYVAVPPLWKECKLCLGLAVPTSPVFAYNANTMVDEDEASTAKNQWDAFLRAAIVDHIVIIIMHFRERAWL